MTKGLLISRRSKIKLNSLSIRKPTAENVAKFKQYRNLYNQTIKAAKKQHFRNRFSELKNNLLKTWQTLYSIVRINKKNSQHCMSLNINGNLINDPTSIAEHFNKFFTEAAVNIVNQINPSSNSPFSTIIQNNNKFSLFNIPLTENEILEATASLKDKKTLDFNGISSYFIKKTISSYVTPLVHIFKLSFSQGVVPSQLKIAKVIPIFKNGDKLNMDNYRPISLLNTFSKILEKIVANRLMSFLNSHNLISNWQFGFRSKHSTLHPMLHLLDRVSNALNEKNTL